MWNNPQHKGAAMKVGSNSNPEKNTFVYGTGLGIANQAWDDPRVRKVLKARAKHKAKPFIFLLVTKNPWEGYAYAFNFLEQLSELSDQKIDHGRVQIAVKATYEEARAFMTRNPHTFPLFPGLDLMEPDAYGELPQQIPYIH